MEHTHDQGQPHVHAYGPDHTHSHEALHSHEPEGQPDWHSQIYVEHWMSSDAANDEQRRPLLRRVANFIPFSHDTEIRVLDIGAGHGVLAHEVLELFPKAVVVCQDFSEPMFDQARERLAWAGDRVSYVKSDLSDSAWAEELREPFDAVVSSMCIHHLGDQRAKTIYREIFPLVWLRGAFLNCDLVTPSGPATTQAYQRDRAFLESGERVGAVRSQRKPTDREAEPATLENQLRWLREAGFKEVDCPLKDRQNVVLAAFRG